MDILKLIELGSVWCACQHVNDFDWMLLIHNDVAVHANAMHFRTFPYISLWFPISSGVQYLIQNELIE